MNALRFVEGLDVRVDTAPVAFTTSAVQSTFRDAREANWITYLVAFGVMTSDSTDTVTVTIEVCPISTTTDSSEEAVPFKYRLSPAVGTTTDPWGTITAATSSGIAVTASADDSKALCIDIDPAAIPADVAGGRWVRCVATPSAQVASGVITIVSAFEPRYPRNGLAETT